MGAHKRGNSRKVGLNCDGNDSVIEDNSASGSSMRQPDIPTNAADNLSVGAVSMGAFTVENIMTPTKSRRPKDNAFMQQRISCWIMLLTPKVVITFFLFSSVTCIIVGVLMKNKVRGVYETSIIYEGTDSSINGCEISVRVRMYLMSAIIPSLVRFVVTRTHMYIVHYYLSNLCWMKRGPCVRAITT